MRKSIWLLSAGLFALATPAHAQQTDTDQGAAQPTDGATAEAGDVDQTTAAQEAPSGDAGDIVVTATRRNEALSDVPLAVSAVTAETLEYSGATDIRALTQVSPSLLVSSTSSEAGAGVARIRGVGTVGDNPGLESSVAVFIDGVYRSRTGVGLTELGSVDRIEVLRGPQGTLFGRNASAGLISIITARPSFTQRVNGELTIGNYDLRRVEVGATGGLTSDIAARVDAVYMQRNGYLRDVISGRSVNDRDRYLVRLQGLYRPNDDFSVRLIGDYSKRDEECCGAPFLPARDFVSVGGQVQQQPSSIAGIERALGAIIRDDTFSRRISITPGRNYSSDVEDYGVSAEAVYDFGGAELTSITAYRFNNFIRGQDADFNNLDILFRADDGGASNRFKTFTQELRLQGEAFGGRLDWLVGGYFANENLRVRDNLGYGRDYLRYANCLLAAGAGLTAALAPTTDPNGTCLNETVLLGARAQAQAGLAQIQAGLAALLAIPPASRTPAQVAQIAALQAQAQAVGGQAALLGALTFTPGNPGFGSLANALGIAGRDPFGGVAADDEFRQRSRNFALFTHNIFEITEGLNVTIGARWTRERKRLNADLRDNNVFCRTLAASPLNALQQLACVVPSTPTGTLLLSDRRTESELSGTAVLSYKPTDQLLTYVSYSRGYKAGGFNLDRAPLPRSGATGNGTILGTATLQSLQFEPEINDATELGLKYNGRGIDVNVAVFNQLYDDFQLNLFNGIAFEVANVNGCKENLTGSDTDNAVGTGTCPSGELRRGVKSRGVEVELFTRPMRDVTLNLGAIYADTRYSNRLVAVGGAATSPQLFQLPGRRISNSSEWTVTGSTAFTPPVGNTGLRGLLYLDARYQSEFNTGSDLDREKIQGDYLVLNGRIGISGPNQLWSVELFAQNITNEEYLQVGFDAPLQGSGTVRGVEQGFYPRSTQLFGGFLAEPRTYGLTLRTRF
jgi:outer membrane receptor protein involved in Fe transport